MRNHKTAHSPLLLSIVLVLGNGKGTAFTADIIEIAGKFLAKKTLQIRSRTSTESSLMKNEDLKGTM